MGTHPIFESDFDCLTDGLMLTQEELLEEANRIIKEFQKYTKDFQIVDSFYHGTYGRCVRFSVVTTECESYRVLFHQTGLSVLNDSSHFESFEQFFNSKSPNYRNSFSADLFQKLSILSENVEDITEEITE